MPITKLLKNAGGTDLWTPLSESTFCLFGASRKMYMDSFLFFFESLPPTGLRGVFRLCLCIV